MKVLHFAPTLQPGAATQLAADLAYALQLFDVQSFLVTSKDNSDIIPISDRLRFIPMSRSLIPGESGSILKLRSIISNTQPDVIQAYGCEAVSLAAKALKRVSGEGKKPLLVATLTGYPGDAAFLRSAELADCAAITCVSKCLRQYVSEARPTLENLWHIPYGVNDTLCCPSYTSPDSWQAEWQLSYPKLKDRFVICVPGAISSAHGTAAIVPVLSTLLQQDIPAHAIIAGDRACADAEFLATLMRRIRAAGLDSLITWIDKPTHLRDIMCSCHAVVSLADEPLAYDRPILEALSLGKPVTGYAHGVTGEYLETFQPVGLVPVRDYDAIADVLSQWYYAPPDPLVSVPYPYRLSDTAKSFFDLYNSLT